MGQRTSVYLDDALHTAVKASGVPVAELIRRGLAATTEPASHPAAPVTSQPDPAPSIATTSGEPSPGTACAGPGCWQRNTTRYGLRRLPLCPACRAALEGQVYKREVPESAARLLRRGAA